MTKAAVATGTLPATLNGTVDLTVSGFGVPDAAILFFSEANTTNNPQDDAGFGVGFWTYETSDNDQFSCHSISEHNKGTSNTSRTHDSSGTRILVVIEPTPSSSRIGAYAESITDGIRLTVSTDNTTVARYVTAYLISGVTNAKAFEEVLSTTTTYDITTPGFKPDIVFAMTVAEGDGASFNHTHNIFSFGVAHNDSVDTVTQAGVMINSVDGQAATVSCSYIDNANCTGQLYNDAVSWKGALGSFDSSGFTLTTDTNPFSDRVYFLALELTSPDDGYVGIIDTATATGDDAHTGFGFQPSAIGLVATMATAVNTVTAGFGISAGMGDVNNERALSVCDEDAATTTVATSQADLSNVLFLRDDAGTTDAVASLSSLDSDGFTLNYSDAAASATKAMVFGLATEIDSVGVIDSSGPTSATGGGRAVTLTINA